MVVSILRNVFFLLLQLEHAYACAKYSLWFNVQGIHSGSQRELVGPKYEQGVLVGA